MSNNSDDQLNESLMSASAAEGDQDCDEDKAMQSDDSNSGQKQSEPMNTSNNEESPPSPPTAPSAQLSSLTEMGLDGSVAAKLATLFTKGKLSIDDLDARAIDALKQFRSEAAIEVLNQFDDSNLEHVSNKSAFLCGLMRTWRQKEKSAKMDGQWGSANSGTNNSTNNNNCNKNNNQNNASSSPSNSHQTQSGPDEAKIKAILERTGYTLDVTTGQRKYGGPPPDWTDPPPPPGCEIFVGKIPKEIYEDELIPLFEKVGKIWDLRLMMDSLNGYSRGYAFVTYCNKDDAQNAVQEYDGYEIRKSKPLKVNVSVPNLRLFVGNIPKSKSKEEIYQEFTKLAGGLSEVIVYSSPDDRKRNRGFCFLEYESHKAASLAKRKLSTARTKVWGCDILVDWADPQEEPDAETMSKVKVLYVRNLTADVTEEQLKSLFEEFGSIERVKKIKDYAFVHFEDRNLALQAMNGLNGRDVGGAHIEVSLAKPPSDRKKKEEVLRNRERRVMLMMQQKSMVFGSPRGPPPVSQLPPPPPPPLIPQTRSARGRNSQTPMAPLPSPSAYHRQLGGRNYDYECGYFGHYDDYAPLPHYDYSPHFSGDGYYHHNMLSPSHSHAPQPLTSAPFTPHSKTRASRNSLGQLRGGIRGTTGMSQTPGGSTQREPRSSGLRHHNRGRIGVNMGTGPSHRLSHHTGGAAFGNQQAMGARSGVSSKRRVMAQRGAAKRKLKSKSGEFDSKQNQRNQQSNESTGAQGEWYEDEFAYLDSNWTK